MFETSDTIVVCRPEQIKEAAVVLSCGPALRFTPLIVMERPPVSEQEYRNLYEIYREARNRRDQFTGATMARRQPLAASALMALNAEVDAKTERLTPYRSWVKHNQLISRWLSKGPPRRAVFLFEVERDDLRLIEPVVRDRIGDSRFAVIPEETEWVYLLPGEALAGSTAGARHYYTDLSRLAELSWEMLHGSAFPKNAIEIAADNLGAYFTGLHKSLATGAPLRPVASGVGTPDLAPVPPGATEAVVIEISNQAARLLGVVYAKFRGAKPVFYAEPDLGQIEAARSAVERKQEESAEAMRYVAAHRESGLQLADLSQADSAALKRMAPAAEAGAAPFEPKRFLAALAQLFGKEDIHPYIQRLEEAVSAAVPDAVVAEVGDLDVTAFTAGTPYNFVRKNGADWSRKTIGHIAGDSSLLILEDLLPTRSEAGVSFNLIFDPGYIKTSETRDVLNELQRRVSSSLVMSGLAGTSLALIYLGGSLPVDLVFFNTHGSDNAILMRDMLLPAYKLVQRVTLPSRPMVFNNSCLSWVGVGREFIRSGARAYAGTLWSVDAGEAAGLARTVIRRMIQENMAAARALRETGVDPVTERAYIFIGPASARLAAEESSSGERERLVSATRYLFSSASGWLNEAGGDAKGLFMAPLVEILVREAEWITAELDRRRPEPGLDRLDLYIMQLGLMAQLPLGDPAALQRVAEIAGRAEDMLGLPDVDEKAKAQRRAHLMQVLSRVYGKIGQFLPAVQCLNASIDAAQKAGDSPGSQYLELSDALKALGRDAEALAAAQRALEAFALLSADQVEDGRLGALGRLAQMSIRLRQYEPALQYARDGFTEAVSRDNLREQSGFKGDETRALLRLDRKDEALATANDQLNLARRAHDDRLEISAYGAMANVLMERKQWPEALEKINAGLAQAQGQGDLNEVGDFLRDLASAKSETGDKLGALATLRRAGPIMLQTGQIAKLKAVVATASELSETLCTWPARTEMLRLEASVIEGLDEGLRREICMDAVRTLKEAIQGAGVAASRKPLRKLRNEISRAVEERGTSASPQLIFVNRALGMLDDWASGRTAKARTEAAALDAMSAGGFEFVAFVGQGH